MDSSEEEEVFARSDIVDDQAVINNPIIHDYKGVSRFKKPRVWKSVKLKQYNDVYILKEPRLGAGTYGEVFR